MKLGAAIAEIMKREGIKILKGKLAAFLPTAGKTRKWRGTALVLDAGHIRDTYAVPSRVVNPH